MAKAFSSIRQRVLFAFFLLAFAGILTSIWNIWALGAYETRLERMAGDNIPVLIAAYEVARQGEAISKGASGVVLTKDKWTRESFVNRINEQFNWLDLQLKTLRENGVDAQRLSHIRQNKEALYKSFEDLTHAVEMRNTTAIQPDADEEHAKWVGEVDRLLLLHKYHADRMTYSVAALANAMSSDISAVVDNTLSDMRVEYWQLVLYGGLTFLFAVLVAYYLDRGVSSRVVAIQQAMRSVADGNTKQEIPQGGEDEIADMADALGTFVEKLGEREERLQMLVNERTSELASTKTTLEINEQRMRNLFEVASDWFFETDEHLRLIAVSPQFFDQLGFRDEALLGVPVFQWLDGPYVQTDKVEIAALIQQVQSRGAFRQFECTVHTPNEQVIHLQIAGVPVFDEAGAFHGYHGAMTDISQSKETEKQLRHAQKMQALGNLAGGVAHSFNNIFQPILILNEMTYNEAPEDSSVRERMAITIDACKRGKDLGDRILLYSRQDEPNKAEIDVYGLVSDTLGLFRSSAPATIDLIESLDSDVGKIVGDTAQLEALLLNLATNARDAIEPGTGEIRISLTRVAQSEVEYDIGHEIDRDAYAKITITDTGCGMDRNVIERIFDPFFTTKGLGQGTGLGLSMASGIVNMHGGGIKVISTPGKGTTFDIFLPLIEAESLPELKTSAE